MKVVFNILYTKFGLDHLSTQPQPLSVFLESEKQVQIISETKLNHVNTKATRGYNR